MKKKVTPILMLLLFGLALSLFLGCKNPVAGNATILPLALFSKQEVYITNTVTSNVEQMSETRDNTITNALKAQLPEALSDALPAALDEEIESRNLNITPGSGTR